MAVLIVAVVALRNPKQASTSAGTDTRVPTPSASSPAGTGSRSAGTGPTSSRASSSPAPATSSSASAIGSKPLIILNDTETPNLARQAATRFEGGGWNVTSFDENYSNNILSTAAYYDPSISGARKAAEALQRQYPTIKRVVARFPQLPAGPIVVVLTTDYSAG